MQGSASGSRQTTSQENQTQRQSTSQENQGQRQSAAEQQQDDRQDYADEHYDGGAYYATPRGVVVVDDDDDAAAALAVGMAVGTVVTAGAMHSATAANQAAAQSAQPAPACTMTQVEVGEETYYHCAPNWYQKAFTNGEMTYVAVNPPPGM